MGRNLRVIGSARSLAKLPDASALADDGADMLAAQRPV